jgi:hypothetical protein
MVSQYAINAEMSLPKTGQLAKLNTVSINNKEQTVLQAC